MQLLTYDEASKLLAVKRGTLYSWVSRGKLPYMRLSGKMVRFDKDQLEQWLDNMRQTPVATELPDECR